MTNQWHLPTTDCELPIGTKIRSSSADLRELTEACLFHTVAGQTAGVAYRVNGVVKYLRDGLPQLASVLPVESLLLPEHAPPEIAVGQVWKTANGGHHVTVLAVDHDLVGCRYNDGGGADSVFTLDTFRGAFGFVPEAPVVTVGQTWRGQYGDVVVAAIRHGVIEYTHDGCRFESNTDQFVAEHVFVSHAHGIVVRQFWRERSDRYPTSLICKIIIATERHIKLQYRDGSTRDYLPESFVKDFDPAPTAVVMGDVYAEHQFTEANQLTMTPWDRLCEEFGQRLVADAKAHGEKHFPILSARALCWIQLEAPGVLKRLEQEQGTADEARRRLDRALALERPERPHPHEGRSERVYQKRRP